MVYLSDLNRFFDKIKENSARSFSTKQLVKDFLQFMLETCEIEEAYFKKDYDPKNSENINFEDYVYKHYLNLNSDLRKEYESIENLSKDRIKSYENRVKELNYKLKILSKKDDKYQHQKYCFFLSINEKLLGKARKAREKASIFREALSKCRNYAVWTECWSFDKSFGDIQQYIDIDIDIDIDWKSYINFSEVSVSNLNNLCELKVSSSQKYIEAFGEYIKGNKISDRLIEMTSQNYYLINRKPIIEEAIRLFKEEKYIPFVYLLVPQIEGLFDVYRDLMGIEANGEAGLSEKLEKMQNKKMLWGYVYYAFDFPELRNNIAHGGIIDVTQEMAYDTLMDVFFLYNEIISDKMQYKIIINFFNVFVSLDSEDKRITYVLDYFSGMECVEHLEWLKHCLDCHYEEIIVWYELQEMLNQLISLFKSVHFQGIAFPNKPLYIEEESTLNGNPIRIRKKNDKIIDYIPLIELLTSYSFLPDEWVSSINEWIHVIDEDSKEWLNNPKN